MRRNLNELSEKILSKKNAVFLFGAGSWGKSVYHFLGTNDIPVSGVADTYKHTPKNGIISLDELSKRYNAANTVVLITVGKVSQREVFKLLEDRNIFYYITIHEFFDNIITKRWWYNTENIGQNDKIAVYTCITNGYDNYHKPLEYSDKCDYYIISDRAIECGENVKYINVRDIVPSDITNPIMQNRFCKMHGHEIFKKYKYSIYLDGSVQILHDISHYIYHTEKSGIAFYNHETRDCIYTEGITAVCKRWTEESKVKKQLKQYAEGGMPINFGMFLGGFIFRKHSYGFGDELMEHWWDEHKKWQTRDQLSLMFVLWKMGKQVSDVGIVNDKKSCAKDGNIRIYKHSI